MSNWIRAAAVGCFVGMVLTGCGAGGGKGDGSGSAASLSSDASSALKQLRSQNEAANALARDAKAVLVFPNVTKGGFVIGGYHGEGVMFRDGKAAGYYDSTGASYGLQAGIQRYGYALFFMREEDIAYLDKSDGWEIGTGPTLTVIDQGFSTSMTTTTGREGVYCIFFDQRGLMAGIGIQGSKITRVYR